ncbi:MAG: lipoyl(octanoyl) transferase LipB [Bacteroidota bacterium]
MTAAGLYRTVQVCSLGRTEYKECWDLQRHLYGLRLANEIPDTFLLTEHDHVYTIGKSGDDNHLLATANELYSKGVPVFHNDRGGDITYHGPGQLVGYPILRLEDYYLDLHRYLRDLEEVIIRTLCEFGVHGKRVPEYTGVWVGNEKICAIGVKASRWVTMHGFALNVSTDLSYFDRIIPCGIFEKGVTSLETVLDKKVEMDEVIPPLVHHFADVFGVQTVEEPSEVLLAEVPDHSHNH